MPKGFNFGGGQGYDLGAIAQGYSSTVNAEEQGNALKHAALQSLADILERSHARQAAAQEAETDRAAARENQDRQNVYNKQLQQASQEFQRGEGELDRGQRKDLADLDYRARIELGYQENERRLGLENLQQSGENERAKAKQIGDFEKAELERRRAALRQEDALRAGVEIAGLKGGDIYEHTKVKLGNLISMYGVNAKDFYSARYAKDPEKLESAMTTLDKDVDIRFLNKDKANALISKVGGSEGGLDALKLKFGDPNAQPATFQEGLDEAFNREYPDDLKGALGLIPPQDQTAGAINRVADYFAGGGSQPGVSGLPGQSVDLLPGAPPPASSTQAPQAATAQPEQPIQKIPLTKEFFTSGRSKLNLDAFPKNIQGAIDAGHIQIWNGADGRLHASGPGGEGDRISSEFLSAAKKIPYAYDTISLFTRNPSLLLNLNEMLEYTPPAQPQQGSQPAGEPEFTTEDEKYLYSKIKKP